MKTKSLLLILLLWPIALSAQDLVMSFTSRDATPLDSITAMNVRSGESITLPGNETLILTSGMGTDLTYMDQLNAVVYPNPNTGQSTIALNIPEQQDIVISVRNQLGQLICQSREFVQAGNQAFYLSLQSAGIYSVSIIHSKGSESLQVISTRNTSQGNHITHIGHLSLPLRKQGSLVIRHSTLKTTTDGNFLAYIMGDTIRYTCYGSIHTTIFQDEPREIKDYNYAVDFHPCVDPDSMSYPVVEIGEQRWMAKNLAYLPEVSPPTINSEAETHYYVYDFDGSSVTEAKATDNYITYGVLYNWEAAQTACPSGWHLPSDDEWKSLELYLGMDETDVNSYGFRSSGEIGQILKSRSGWNNNGNGQNSMGFNAIPAGGCNNNNGFRSLGNSVQFWNSTTYASDGGNARKLLFDEVGVVRINYVRGFGESVRCLKDTTN